MTEIDSRERTCVGGRVCAGDQARVVEPTARLIGLGICTRIWFESHSLVLPILVQIKATTDVCFCLFHTSTEKLYTDGSKYICTTFFITANARG
jgi:hypothetical protein